MQKAAAAKQTRQQDGSVRVAQEKEQRFWDRMADRYFKQPIGDEAAYQRKLEKTREYLTPQSDVLEFGCGTGGTAVLHAPFVQSYLATDISGEMLRIAETRAAEASVTNVTFERASFADLDRPDASFDAVLGLSILHLVPDRDEAIAKAGALLKPGGVLVTSTVCMLNGYWFFWPIAPLMRALGKFPMVRFFTRGQLLNSMRAAGFEIEFEWVPAKSSTIFVIARKPA